MAVLDITGTIPSAVAGCYAGYASRNGKFFAASLTTGGAVVFQVNDDQTLTERPVQKGSTSTTGYNIELWSVAISNDGNYLIEIPYNVAAPAYPVKVLKWNGSEYVYLSALASISSSYMTACDFSESGQYLAIGFYYGVRVYKISGDTFTSVATIANNAGNLNGLSIEDVRWSHNGNFLAVAGRERLQVYSFTGTAFTRRLNGAATGGWGCDWSIADDYVFCSVEAVGAGLFGWSRSGTTFTPINSGNSLWADAIVAAPFSFTLNEEEYLFFSTAASGVNALPKAGGYAPANVVPITDLGFSAVTASATWRMGGGRDPVSGAQTIWMPLAGFPYGQAWWIEPDITLEIIGEHEAPFVEQTGSMEPTRWMVGDHVAPFVETAGELKYTSSISGGQEAPFIECAGVLSVDGVIYEGPTFAVFSQYIDVRTGGDVVNTSNPGQFVYSLDMTAPFIETTGLIAVGVPAFGDMEAPFVEQEGVLRQALSVLADMEAPFVESNGSLKFSSRVSIAVRGFTPVAHIDLQPAVTITGNVSGLLPRAAVTLQSTSEIEIAARAPLPQSAVELKSAAVIESAVRGFLPVAHIVLGTGSRLAIDAYGLLPKAALALRTQASITGHMTGVLPTTNVVLSARAAISGAVFGLMPRAAIDLTSTAEIAVGAVGILPRTRIRLSAGSTPSPGGGNGVSPGSGTSPAIGIGGGGIVPGYGNWITVG